MNKSKLFVSSTAAAAVISAIGFAYAQTAPNSPSGSPTNPQTQNQGMTPDQSTTVTPATPRMQNQSPSTATGRMNRDTTGMQNNARTNADGTTSDNTRNMGSERVARADRN